MRHIDEDTLVEMEERAAFLEYCNHDSRPIAEYRAVTEKGYTREEFLHAIHQRDFAGKQSKCA